MAPQDTSRPTSLPQLAYIALSEKKQQEALRHHNAGRDVLAKPWGAGYRIAPVHWNHLTQAERDEFAAKGWWRIYFKGYTNMKAQEGE